MEEQLPKGLSQPSPETTLGLGRGVRVASSPRQSGRRTLFPSFEGEQSGQKRPVTFRSEERSLGTPWQSTLPERWRSRWR